MGTNTFQGLAAYCDNDGVYRRIWIDCIPVLLAKRGLNNKRAVKAVTEPIRYFLDKFGHLRADRIIAVGTWFFRNNQEIAVHIESLFREMAHVPVTFKVLSGEDEARYIWEAARYAAKQNSVTGEVLAIDIGGGSIEIIHGNVEPNNIMFSTSIPSGTVNVYRSPEESLEKLKSYLWKVKQHIVATPVTLIGVGAPFESIINWTYRRLETAVIVDSMTYPVWIPLSCESLFEVITEWLNASEAEINTTKTIADFRKWQLKPLARILRTLLSVLPVGQVYLCRYDIRDGVAIQYCVRGGRRAVRMHARRP